MDTGEIGMGARAVKMATGWERGADRKWGGGLTLNKGLATYMDKEKALDYLRVSAPIAEASNNQELLSVTNIDKNLRFLCQLL